MLVLNCSVSWIIKGWLTEDGTCAFPRPDVKSVSCVGGQYSHQETLLFGVFCNTLHCGSSKVFVSFAQTE